MKQELENEDFVEASESTKMHNITSKAGRLAMELSLEKKKLIPNRKDWSLLGKIKQD